ncbi:MAG: class I SAM-dependent methyltransferase [Tepidisphaerales bacterium]
MDAQGATCPVCGGPATLYCSKPRDGRNWAIYRCGGKARPDGPCGHGFVHPRPTLDEVVAANASETAASALQPPTPPQALQLRDVAEVVRAVRQVAGEPLSGRMLDVGAGDGAYAAGLSTLGLRPHLIDLDPRVQDAAARIPGATAARETFEGLSDVGPYRLVLMSHVLEHALDPLDWLSRAARLLVPASEADPGGLLVVLLPNFGGLYRLLGARDPYLIPPVHVNYFTAASLRRSFQLAGLSPVRIDTDTHIPFSGGLKRRVAACAVRLVGPLVRNTTRGIILRGFARPARRPL